MSPSCARNHANQTESVLWWGATAGRAGDGFIRTARRSFPTKNSNEATFDAKFSQRWRACGMNHLLQPDRGFLVFALSIQWRIDKGLFPVRPAPNDGEIFFLQL